MGGERASGERVAEFRIRIGPSTRDQRVRVTVGGSLRVREKARIGMERRRDDGFLRRIARAAGRQDDGGALRKPGRQKPQKEVMGKMIDGKSSLESVGAAGVVIWK